MKAVLGCFYASRCLMIFEFLVLSKNILGIYSFAFFEVSLEMIRYHRAFLLGLIFFAHQIGSFFSTWLGGIYLMAT